MAKPRPATNTSLLPILSELQPLGDGRFILRPRVPDLNGCTWLKPRDAVQLLQVPNKRHVYRFIENGLLVYKRPSKALYVIRLDSANRLRLATQDPEFWETKPLQTALRAWVAQELRNLIAEALQLSKSDTR